MSKRLFVPASRRDIKPGAKIRVNYDHRRPARDLAVLYGTVTTDPVRMRRGDLMFSIESGGGSVVIRHGDYTGTGIWVEVDRRARIKSTLEALKRSYKRPDPLLKVILTGGPFAGSEWLYTNHSNTLPLEFGQWRGRYNSGGEWVPA